METIEVSNELKKMNSDVKMQVPSNNLKPMLSYLQCAFESNYCTNFSIYRHKNSV